MFLPPIGTERSGFRACSVNSDGAFATCSRNPVRVELHELALDVLAAFQEVLERLLVQKLDAELADDAAPAALELGPAPPRRGSRSAAGRSSAPVVLQ